MSVSGLPIGRRPGLRFIHAGANDGATNDWLHRSIVADGWQGICLEPQPRVFERLRTTYAATPGVTLICGAIADASGSRVLYSFQHPHSAFDALCDKLASFDRAVLLSNVAVELRKFPELDLVLDDWVYEHTVRCFTIAELIELHRFAPDLIALDIEGCEDEILLSLDLAAVRPSFVFFEAHHLSKARKAACVDKLRAAGYQLRGIAEYGIAEFNLLATRAPADTPL